MADVRQKRLSHKAIEFSFGLDEDRAKELAERLAARDNRVNVVVANLDIRRSTPLLLNLEDRHRYAAVLAAFVGSLRKDVNETHGCFDKFTGDGALVWWIVDPLEAKRLLAEILPVVVYTQIRFLKDWIPELRGAAGCIPEAFGLSVGVDSGECLLTDLGEPAVVLRRGSPEAGEEDDASDAPTAATRAVSPTEIPPLNSVTILGRAVVGATRMMQAAKPFQIILNEQVGSVLEDELREREHFWYKIYRINVDNKDLGVPAQQNAYELRNWIIDSHVERFYRRGPQLRGAMAGDDGS